MTEQEAGIRLDEHMRYCRFCHPDQKSPYFCERYKELARLAGKEVE